MLDLSSEKAQSFYYSSHHLARDLFWNVGSFCFFLLWGAALEGRFRASLWCLASRVANLKSAAPQIAIAISLLAFGAVAGIITAQIFAGLLSPLSRTRLRGLTFDGHYKKDEDLLRLIYNKAFGNNATLLLSADYRPMDLVVRLTTYMRLYNPSGYVHVFRTYSMVGLFRQAVCYSLALLAWSSIVARCLSASIVLVLSIVLLLYGLSKTITYSVTREYAFLLATLQWTENQISLAKQEAEIAAKKE